MGVTEKEFSKEKLKVKWRMTLNILLALNKI